MKYEFDRFTLDTDARQLTHGSEAVHLTPKAFELLELLIAKRPRAVAKQELYDALWPGTYVVDGNLPVLIREIRNALGDQSRSRVRTVHRFGYAFDEEVTSSAVHLLAMGDRDFRLKSGDNVVGRDPKADVSLPWPSVSRRHAVIHVQGNDATLTDLNSKNGTRVAGREATEPVQLADGVVIQFGKVEVTYRCPAQQGETETAM